MLLYAAAAIAGLMAAAIIAVGAIYLFAPGRAAAAFGLPARPVGDASAWLKVKGVRDIVSGLPGLALLAAGEYQMLGAFLLIVALVPAGDALIVIAHRGSLRAAVAIHGMTAAILVAAGLVLLLHAARPAA